MTKIELAKIAFRIERSQGRMLNVTFKRYFDFMWRNERKDRVVAYIAHLQK